MFRFKVKFSFLLCSAFIFCSQFSVAENKTLLIRPFGDSITYGVGFASSCTRVVGLQQEMCWPPSQHGGGYRGFMTLLAVQNKNISFITEGYRSDGSYILQWNTNTQSHEGYPGYTNSRLNAEVAWHASFSDITLLHSGTNDLWDNSWISAKEASNNLKNLLTTLLKHNNGEIFVAKIISMGAEADPKFSARVNEYNATICNMVKSFPAVDLSRIYVVDMSSILDPETDYSDTVHPNYLGYEKMAKKWIAAITSPKIEHEKACPAHH